MGDIFKVDLDKTCAQRKKLPVDKGFFI